MKVFLELIKEFYNIDIDDPDEIYLFLKNKDKYQEEDDEYYAFDVLIANLLKVHELEMYNWQLSNNY